MPIDFYQSSLSPFCRSVHLTAKALGVELNLKPTDVLNKKENLKPEFLKLNPQHTIPTIVDGSFVLWESRAICTYLASAYGKNDSIYPCNPQARAKVDQRLYFDMGTLFQRLVSYMSPAFRGTKPDASDLAKLDEACGWLNEFLNESSWAAGNEITVADFCLIATVSSIEAIDIIDFSKYPKIQHWIQRCKGEMVGYDEVNAPGAKALGEFVKAKFNEVM